MGPGLLGLLACEARADQALEELQGKRVACVLLQTQLEAGLGRDTVSSEACSWLADSSCKGRGPQRGVAFSSKSSDLAREGSKTRCPAPWTAAEGRRPEGVDF